MSQKQSEKSGNYVLVCPEKLQDVRGLAEYLGVEVTWIYKNMSRLPHRKVGKYRRFCREDVERWRAQEQKQEEANQ
jgi:excisionase family DNA binding protein